MVLEKMCSEMVAEKRCSDVVVVVVKACRWRKGAVKWW